MRIIVTGGGTGGHIFPALEIAKEIIERHQDAEVIFVGNKNSLEEVMTQRAGFRFYGIAMKKLVGQSISHKILALLYLKAAVWKSMWFLARTKPQAVIGVGGYVSAPMLIASFFLSIRRYVCEQNVVPGLANVWLGRIATRVFISFDESRRYFHHLKTIRTGNPVRREFFQVPEKQAPQAVRILVTGGSLGARFLNQHIPAAFAAIKRECPLVAITHQTGKNEVNQVKQSYDNAGIKAYVTHFIDDMPAAFSSHDLLISRAGATVCAEIMASGMPSILIPYPHANAHQKHNAYALTKEGAAITILEDQNFSDHLASVIKDLYSEPKKLADMSVKAKIMGSHNASSAIVTHVFSEIIGRGNGN